MPSFDEELNELGDDGPDPGPPGPKVPELGGPGGQVSQLAANKPPAFEEELAGLEDPQPEPEPGWMRAMRATGLVRDPANADEARGLPSLAGAKNFTDKMELMGNHPWKAAGQEVASLAAPLAMGPSSGVAGGVIRGALQGGLGQYADTGDPAQAATAALEGGMLGGGTQILGNAAQGLGNGIRTLGDRIAQLPAIQAAGRWAGKAAGAAAGGAAGSALGSAVGPLGAPLAAGGAALGADLGGRAGQAALTGAIRTGGHVAGAVGDLAGDPTARAAALAATLSGGRRAAPVQNSPQQQAFNALESGRGNKLSDAALSALQNQPQALGEYTDRFAQAASSPEPGAVNDLISKLMDTDPKFRMGPLLELQRMTAE